MFRPSRVLLSALTPVKASTNITGLQVHHDPINALTKTYHETLSLLSALPSTSVYRQATEALTKHKLSIVTGSNGDAAKVEKELGMVETAIVYAHGELNLAGKMLEWKAWENLEQDAPKGQWRYFEPGNDDDPESMPR